MNQSFETNLKFDLKIMRFKNTNCGILVCMLILTAIRSSAQLTEFNFVFQSTAPTCNPFKDQINDFRFDSKWSVSHNTPEVDDYSNSQFYNVEKLKSEKSQNGVEKSEGLSRRGIFDVNGVWSNYLSTVVYTGAAQNICLLSRFNGTNISYL
jgi:hypothetical protein